MTANPTTDQYLAFMRDRTDPTLEEEPIAKGLVEVMRILLPDVPPAVIGEVMLHAGAQIGDIASEGGWTPRGIAVLLCVAGRKLHAGETQ